MCASVFSVGKRVPGVTGKSPLKTGKKLPGFGGGSKVFKGGSKSVRKIIG